MEPTCPAFPPVRVGGGVYWRDSNWFKRLNLLHAFAQDDVALIGETPTAGYNLLKAEITYKTKLDASWFGAREMTLGLVGNNLLNENIRNSVSHQGRSHAAEHRRAGVCELEVLERFQAKWIPVRVKKTRQIKNLELRSDPIGTEKALLIQLEHGAATAPCSSPAGSRRKRR